MKALLILSEDGDWIGLYVDGKLELEGHSLRTQDVIHALGIEANQIEKSVEWFDGHGGRCPAEYKE